MSKLSTIVSVSAPQKGPQLTSPSALCSVMVARMNVLLKAGGGRFGVYHHDDSTAVGPPVLSAAEVAELVSLEKEADLVRVLTPKLKAVHDSLDTDAPHALRRVLVNSENHRWLDNLHEPLGPQFLKKPDLYVTWQPFIIPGKPFGRQGTGSAFLYGGLAHRSLQLDGCVPVIIEAKLDGLGNAEVGELMDCHQQVPGLVHGFLFDRRQFVLYESTDGTAVRLTWCKWDQTGTEQLLREHLRPTCVTQVPRLVDLLTKLTAALDVEFVEQGDGKECFLGAGAYGRVFAVRRKEDRPGGQLLALKAVLKPSLDRAARVWEPRLPTEFHNQKRAGMATLEGKLVAVPVVEDSLKQFKDLGGGYLLGGVGAVFSVANKSDVATAVAALWRLHKVSITHGDPRVANLVLVNGCALWVDLMGIGGPSDDDVSFTLLSQLDMRVLAASILNTANIDDLPLEVLQAIDAYAPSSKATMDAVVAALWRSI